jgi:TolB-like protein
VRERFAYRAMSKVAPNSGPPVIGGGDSALPLLRPESIQRHLEKVVVSEQMRHSRKLCQFLRYTVEEVLKGHGAELKEYAIGVGAFRRAREFDPGADPIVRVQARRLRSKLELYYQTEGRDEAVRIEYPKGSYSPTFTRRTPVAASQLAHPGIQVREDKSVQYIAILPFIGIGGADSEAFGDGLTDELMHALSSWPDTRVIARSSCFQFKDRSEDVRRIGEWLGVSALVSGSVRIEDTHVRVLAQLVDTVTGVNLWSCAYDREIDGILATQQRISREVAGIVKSRLTSLSAVASSTTA